MNGPRPPMAPWMAMSRTVHSLPSALLTWKLATADWMALLFTLPIGSSRSYCDRSTPIQPDMNTRAPSGLA